MASEREVLPISLSPSMMVTPSDRERDLALAHPTVVAELDPVDPHDAAGVLARR